MKPKIIHTETFSCADDHPIVYYTFDENNEAICEYCSAKFIYKPLEPLSAYIKDFHDKMVEEKELLEMSMKESFRQRDERIEKEKKTYSEEMQDKIEPIDNDYVNKILKGSG